MKDNDKSIILSIGSKLLLIFVAAIILLISNVLAIFIFNLYVKTKHCGVLDDFSRDMCLANANASSIIIVPIIAVVFIIILSVIFKHILYKKF